MKISEMIEHLRAARDAGHLDPEAANSTISFLRERMAPMPVEVEGSRNIWWYICGNCHTDINHRDKYCHECGKPIKWDG